MGYGKEVACTNCGNSWTHYTGHGFSFVYYHCDKCGKEKTAKHDSDLSGKCGSCECGGEFSINNDKIICPKCQSQVESDDTFSILWD